jgi:hypothetical protein
MTDPIDDHKQGTRRSVNDILALTGRILRATVEGRCASAADLDFALRYAMVMEATDEDVSDTPFFPIYVVLLALLPEALRVKYQTEPIDRPP